MLHVPPKLLVLSFKNISLLCLRNRASDKQTHTHNDKVCLLRVNYREKPTALTHTRHTAHTQEQDTVYQPNSYIPLSYIHTYCTSVHVHVIPFAVTTTGFSSKPKFGRVGSEPVRKKSASSAPPAKKFPMRHQTSVPEMFYKSEQVRSMLAHR